MNGAPGIGSATLSQPLPMPKLFEGAPAVFFPVYVPVGLDDLFPYGHA